MLPTFGKFEDRKTAGKALGSSLAQQFDAVFHLDETAAVEPLDTPVHWHDRELPETYPFGV